MKKWLSVLAAVLALCLLPVYAMAAIPYDYDPSTNTYTYTVSGSHSTSDKITVDKTGASSVKIIFESGSSLETQFFNDSIYVSDDLDLYIEMNGSSITSEQAAIEISESGSTFITARGTNTVKAGSDRNDVISCYGDITIEAIGGTISIEAQNINDEDELAPCAIRTWKNVYLGGGVTVVGGVNTARGKDQPAIEAKKIFVKAAPGMGVNVYVGNSAGDCWLVQGSPFADGADITDLVEDYRYIRTESAPLDSGVPGGPADPEVPSTPAAPSAPKTGDSANLALWVCLLAASVLGMTGMKRKAKRS